MTFFRSSICRKVKKFSKTIGWCYDLCIHAEQKKTESKLILLRCDHSQRVSHVIKWSNHEKKGYKIELGISKVTHFFIHPFIPLRTNSAGFPYSPPVHGGGFSLNCTDLSCWPVKLLIDESSKSQWRWKGIWNAIQNEAETKQTSFMIILLWVACKNRDESTLDRYVNRYNPTFR